MDRPHPLHLVLVVGLLGCATAAPSHVIEPPSLPTQSGGAEPPEEDLPVHINEQWWPFRAAALKITEAQARARDAAISPKAPPREFWDAQVAVEAASIWSTFCNECHGGRRRVGDARKMPVPPPEWGDGAGLFFGGRRSYGDVFSTISKGKMPTAENRPRMPAWGGRIPREMIWGLIYFIEYQSGGIEGRFPPSLYPRSEHAGGL
jgi:hypothetical protein